MRKSYHCCAYDQGFTVILAGYPKTISVAQGSSSISGNGHEAYKRELQELAHRRNDLERNQSIDRECRLAFNFENALPAISAG